MTEPLDIKFAVDTLEKLGLIDVVKDKLIGNPDRAARHLAYVLAIIENVYMSLELEVLKLTTLEFSPKKELNKSRTYLRRLKISALSKQITEANAACKQIKVIYRRWLNVWFRRVLNPQEADELEYVFDLMALIDEHLVSAMEVLSTQMKKFGETVLDALDNDGAKAAERSVRAVEKELDSELERLNWKLAELGKLKGKFLELSRALPA
jgi:hypothetical protein